MPDFTEMKEELNSKNSDKVESALDKPKQYELMLRLSRIFSAGTIISFILLMFLINTVLSYFLLPPLFGFFLAWLICPWLQNIKPNLFEAIIWRIFIVGILIGIALSVFALRMQ